MLKIMSIKSHLDELLSTNCYDRVLKKINICFICFDLNPFSGRFNVTNKKV